MAATLIGHVLLVVLVAVYSAVGLAGFGLVWLLRREGVFGRRRIPQPPPVRVLPACRPLAIEPAVVIRPAVALPPVVRERSHEW